MPAAESINKRQLYLRNYIFDLQHLNNKTKDLEQNQRLDKLLTAEVPEELNILANGVNTSICFDSVNKLMQKFETLASENESEELFRIELCTVIANGILSALDKATKAATYLEDVQTIATYQQQLLDKLNTLSHQNRNFTQEIAQDSECTTEKHHSFSGFFKKIGTKEKKSNHLQSLINSNDIEGIKNSPEFIAIKTYLDTLEQDTSHHISLGKNYKDTDKTRVVLNELINKLSACTDVTMFKETLNKFYNPEHKEADKETPYEILNKSQKVTTRLLHLRTTTIDLIDKLAAPFELGNDVKSEHGFSWRR